jgi:hypothetical protein
VVRRQQRLYAEVRPVQTEAVREKLFTMRMSAEEWERAEKLANHYGLTVAGLFRLLMKEKERAIATELAPRAAKKGTKR